MSAQKKNIRWSILVVEIVLVAAFSLGLGTLLFNILPCGSGIIVIVLTVATFPLVRRKIDVETHIIIVFSLWVALTLLSMAFPQSPVGRVVMWVARMTDL